MPIVHCEKEPYDIYIGRPSKWGNPFSHKKSSLAKYKVKTRAQSITQYEWYLKEEILKGNISLIELASLHNKILGCWCAPKPCHGTILLAAAKWAHEKLNQSNKL